MLRSGFPTQISFTGCQRTQSIVDKQSGEDCWLEALENVIQLYYGDVNGELNNWSDWFRKAMVDCGYPGYNRATDNVDNPIVRYPEILAMHNISTEWLPFFPFDMMTADRMINALNENRCILVRLNCSQLSIYRGQAGNHALVLTDCGKDREGNLMLRVIDSNFKNQDLWCRGGEILNAIRVRSASDPNHLILSTVDPVAWPVKS